MTEQKMQQMPLGLILLDPLEYGEYDGLEKLIAEFNEKLKKLDSPSWTAGIVRTTYKLVD